MNIWKKINWENYYCIKCDFDNKIKKTKHIRKKKKTSLLVNKLKID